MIHIAETETYRLINAVEELSNMLLHRLWSDDDIKDRFELAALADAIRVSALRLSEVAGIADDRGEPFKVATENDAE
jgi:hypothetical protein